MDQPAALPPPGQEQILVNPPNQIYLAVITISVCLPITTVLVAMRMYTNMFIARRPRKDDIFIFFCYCFFVAYCIILMMSTKHGSFVNVWDLTNAQLTEWRKWAYIAEIMYFALLFCVKLSVCVLYRRLFCPARGAMNWIYYLIIGTAVFNFAYYCTTVFLVAFTCHPVARVWDGSVPGTCLDIHAIVIASGVMDIITEVLLIAIPLVVFLKWRLPHPDKYRAEVAILISSSLFTLAFTIVGIYFRLDSAYQGNLSMILSKLCLWTFAEIVGAFCTTCLATTPEMIRHFRNPKELKSKGPAVDVFQDPFAYDRKPIVPRLPWIKGPHKVSIADEDPYYMFDEFASETDAETLNNEITVQTEWNVASMPKTHKQSNARRFDGPFRYIRGGSK